MPLARGRGSVVLPRTNCACIHHCINQCVNHLSIRRLTIYCTYSDIKWVEIDVNNMHIFSHSIYSIFNKESVHYCASILFYSIISCSTESQRLWILQIIELVILCLILFFNPHFCEIQNYWKNVSYWAQLPF